jgi:6-phosphogluconolactonase
LRDVPAVDLVLLGLGEDGHTASLFPGHPWGADADSPATLSVLDAPKPPRERVSLSAARLSLARTALVLALGAGKRDAVHRWQRGEGLPVRSIAPMSGVDVFVDYEARREG